MGTGTIEIKQGFTSNTRDILLKNTLDLIYQLSNLIARLFQVLVEPPVKNRARYSEFNSLPRMQLLCRCSLIISVSLCKVLPRLAALAPLL